MSTIQRIFRWSLEEVCEQWRAILSISPHHIGCSIQYAVEKLSSFLKTCSDNSQNQLFLPDVTSLPALVDDRRKTLHAHLAQFFAHYDFDNLYIHNARSILIKCIYPRVRTVPLACTRGLVSIPALEMKNVSRKGQYRGACEFLDTIEALKCTHPRFCPGKKTRLYQVNVPLVLCLVGLCSDELDWNLVTKTNSSL